jgi:hypothetical protein
MVGFEGRRLQFEVPGPGGNGGRRAVESFAALLGMMGPPRLRKPAPDALLRDEGLDTVLSLLAWLDGQAGLIPDTDGWLRAHGLPTGTPGGPILAAGLLPHLDTLAGPLFSPASLPEMLGSALRVLERLGMAGAGIACGALTEAAAAKRPALREAGEVIALSDARATEALRAQSIRATPLESLILERSDRLPPPRETARVACGGSAGERAILEALGMEAVDVGPDPLPSGFLITPEERAAAERRLARAEAEGAGMLLVREPLALARWALVTRFGSWRGSRVAPALPHQIAALALEGEAAGFRALRRPVRSGTSRPEATP